MPKLAKTTSVHEKLYDQLCHQHELRHMDGKYVLADILVAKADVLNALAHLKKGK